MDELESAASSVDCRCDGGQPKNFLRPCLMLLLKEEPAHGYDLLERLSDFGFSRDPGGLYRTLRVLESEGLVISYWESAQGARDRRTYELTREGQDVLDAWAVTLEASRRTLHLFLHRYKDTVEARSQRRLGLVR